MARFSLAPDRPWEGKSIRQPDAAALLEFMENSGGEADAAALGTAQRADAALVHLRHGHDDARQLRTVKEDLAEEQLCRVALKQAADDLAVIGVAHDAALIFGKAALAAAIHGRDDEAGLHVVEQSAEFGRFSAVTVEQAYGRQRLIRSGRAGKFGVNARAAHAGEVQVITFRARGLKFGFHKFKTRAKRFHFRDGSVPESVDIRRTGISALIDAELGKRHVENRHRRFLLDVGVKIILQKLFGVMVFDFSFLPSYHKASLNATTT